MSRTATATPPAPYFPQRVSTPTLRHSSSPSVTTAHLAKSHHHHHQAKRRAKQVTPKANKTVPAEALGLSFEDVTKPSPDAEGFVSGDMTMRAAPISRTQSIASFATVESYSTARTNETDDTEESMRLTPTPPFSFTDTASLTHTPLATPASSIASLPGAASASNENRKQASDLLPGTEALAIQSPSGKTSWVPSFGKMAKAVVHTGKSMGMPFGDRRKRESTGSVSVPVPIATPTPKLHLSPSAISTPVSAPSISRTHSEVRDPPTQSTFHVLAARASQPSRAELQVLSGDDALRRKREWAEAERNRIYECARLCSQWPQSGYNQSKFGPNGSRCYYEPQSYANPSYVAQVMAKQAELEQSMSRISNFFSCRTQRSSTPHSTSASDATEPSVQSYASSQASPASSMHIDHERTEADIKAAMSSLIIPSPGLSPTDGASQITGSNSSLVSLPSSTDSSFTPKFVKGARSISELDALASSMVLSKDDACAMDIDVANTSAPTISTSDSDLAQLDRQRESIIAASQSLRPPTRPHRAQSCGSKRPLVIAEAMEEDKRRKVDEAMVIEEAVSTGVIMPPTRVVKQNMSSSTPDLSAAQSQPHMPGQDGVGAVFGHVVKTSDTHPIIISPFFPAQLLPILAEHLIRPTDLDTTFPTLDHSSGSRSKPQTLFLSSAIDVPSLVLSYGFTNPQASQPFPSALPALTHLPPSNSKASSSSTSGVSKVGNLLLSSCPGKRLRMDGPVKGRGPVCRDLATDLRRIKNEGVGCLVCCLDDTELALLGVPWETYRDIAAETGLDVIRLPMPDGFTPVSLSLFDSHLNRIVSGYTLQGVDVLVHCRGGVGRAGLTACAWAIKMGYVAPHPSLSMIEDAALARVREAKGETEVHSDTDIDIDTNPASPVTSQPKTATALPGEGPTRSISTDHVKQAYSPCTERGIPAELEHQIVMSIVERVIAMIRSARGLKAIESFEQVQFLVSYTAWLRRVAG